MKIYLCLVLCSGEFFFLFLGSHRFCFIYLSSGHSNGWPFGFRKIIQNKFGFSLSGVLLLSCTKYVFGNLLHRGGKEIVEEGRKFFLQKQS